MTLNNDDAQLEEGLLTGTPKAPTHFLRHRWRRMAGGLLALCVLTLLVRLSVAASAPSGVHPATPVFPISESEQLNWGQYSPYFPLAEYVSPPRGCEIDQVRNVPLVD